MFLAIKNKNININNIVISEKKKNNIINDSYFYRIYYTNNNFISNGIVVNYRFVIYNMETFFKKIKLNFKEKDNIHNIRNIIMIEQQLLNYFTTVKTKKHLLRDQLRENFLKIQNNNESLNLSNLNLVLKISGYWETSKEIGLTYRFFITENV